MLSEFCIVHLTIEVKASSEASKHWVTHIQCWSIMSQKKEYPSFMGVQFGLVQKAIKGAGSGGFR